MTQTEYREMCRLEEEIRRLSADNIVWSAQAEGFKSESDMRGRQIKMLGEEADLLIEKIHEMEAEHFRLRTRCALAEKVVEIAEKRPNKMGPHYMIWMDQMDAALCAFREKEGKMGVARKESPCR